MGGPQSPLKTEIYPYIADEIRLTKEALQAKKTILGICLGAQIIGEALDARTEVSPQREIGCFPVNLSAAGKEDPLFKQFPTEFDVMHWHNDMPGLAHDSLLLAGSAGCPRQAVKYKDNVYGLQFHLELTPDIIKGLIDHCRDDLKTEKYVQSPEELLALEVSAINQKMYAVLDYLAAKTFETLNKRVA
jgi:GMP synthase (glutamine-hydrolysing)